MHLCTYALSYIFSYMHSLQLPCHNTYTTNRNMKEIGCVKYKMTVQGTMVRSNVHQHQLLTCSSPHQLISWSADQQHQQHQQHQVHQHIISISINRYQSVSISINQHQSAMPIRHQSGSININLNQRASIASISYGYKISRTCQR